MRVAILVLAMFASPRTALAQGAAPGPLSPEDRALAQDVEVEGAPAAYVDSDAPSNVRGAELGPVDNDLSVSASRVAYEMTTEGSAVRGRVAFDLDDHLLALDLAALDNDKDQVAD